MRQSLRIRASLNNLTDLTVPADFAFSLEIKCVSCREVHPTPVVVSRDEEFEISGSRGTANLVWKCGFCKRESSLNVEPAFGKAEEGGEWATLATFEGRGLEIVGFQPGTGFQAKSTESNTAFDEIDLSDPEGWADYDEKGGCEVSIMDFESKIEKAK